MTPYFSAPKTGTVQTVGAVQGDVVTFDLSSTTAFGVAINNAMITAMGIVKGRTATGDYARIQVERSFSREAGSVATLDVAAVVLGTSFTSAAVATATADLDFSGNSIRLRSSGVAAITLNWTGFLWIYVTDF